MSVPAGFVTSAPVAPFQSDPELCIRVHAEFREMPGLKLTLPQAARLFSIESDRCARVLAALVTAGHVVVRGSAFEIRHGAH